MGLPDTQIGPAGPGDFPACQTHLTTLSRYAEQNFRARLTALGQQPGVPVPVMARAFVEAHVAILEAWLADELDGDVEQLASMTPDLLIYGTAWAHGLRPGEPGHPAGPSPDARPPGEVLDGPIFHGCLRLAGVVRRHGSSIGSSRGRTWLRHSGET